MRIDRTDRFPLAAIALLLLASACGGGPDDPAAGSAAARDVPQYPIEAFLEITNYAGASFSPDGDRILVRSDATGIFNAYAIPVDGSEPVQLTDSTTESIVARAYFPDDERFIYESDEGGNELDHVYVRDPGGTVVDLTPGEEVKASFLKFAEDGETFFVATNERDQRYFDVYEYRVDGYERELFYKDERGFQVADVSPDRRFVALNEIHTTNDSDVWLHDRENDQTLLLTPHLGEVQFQALEFSPDGSRLLYLTNADGEFFALRGIDPSTRADAPVYKADWDVTGATYSKNGKYLVISVNADARTDLRVLDTESDAPVELPADAAADITALTISPDETTMAFYMSRSRNPNDLFVWTIGSADPPRQLTESLNPAIDPDDLVDPEVVRFESWDGLEIPGILYKPHQASAKNKVPALVWVHGGPGGQSRVGYNNLIQYLVNHGYAIYAINNRGSSGYGKTFYALDDRNHGEGDLDDCVASKRMLIDTGYVDPERIGILGGSYGGFMVLAALTSRPQEFAVGVDIFGVANWLRTLQSIPPYWEAIREALYAEMGDPAEDEERLRRISPLFHAGNIERPLMVLQGANDPRVLKVESDEMVEAARANGATVEYLVFDDEGHGFAKKENRLRGYKAIREFLDLHLKNAPADAGPTPSS